MLAGCHTIRAAAFWHSRDGGSVHSSGVAQDEEGGAGAVQEANVLAESSLHPVIERLVAAGPRHC